MSTQTVAPTITCLQVINIRIKYLARQPRKTIFYPSNYYDWLKYHQTYMEWESS